MSKKLLKNFGDIDVAGIKHGLLRDQILKSGKKITMDVDPSDFLYRVDGFEPNDPITWKYVIDLGASLGYAKKLRNFLNIKLNIDIKKEIDKVKKIRKGTKRIPGIKDYIPNINIPYSHSDLWTYLISGYIKNIPIAKSKSKVDKVIKINLSLSEYEDLINYFTEKGKIKELIKFISNVPQTGSILKALQDFLRILGEIIRGEDKIKIDSGASNVFLPIEEYDQWKKSMIKYIGSYNDPAELNEIYIDGILKKGTFLNYIFNIEPKGVGRGEFLLVYTIYDATFVGGSEGYDVILRGQKIILEVKDYSNPNIGEFESIRLGTHGKSSQYDFFQEIRNSVSIARKIWNILGPEKIKNIVGKYNFQYWKNMTSQANYTSEYKAIPSAVNAGELPLSRLRIIIEWHLLNQYLIEELSNNTSKYTFSTLSGNNLESILVKIDPLDLNEIDNGKSIKIYNTSDADIMIAELNTLKYIKSPAQLIYDIENSAKNYFSKILNNSGLYPMKFKFLIFRHHELKILEDNEFQFDTITQSAIKITELPNNIKSLSVMKNIMNDYKKLGESSSYNNFWEFYRKSISNGLG